MKFNALPSNSIATIASKDEGPGSQNKWILGYANNYGGVAGATVLHINSAGGASVFLGSDPWVPTPGTWYHLAVVKEGNTYRFYRNAVLEGTRTTTVALPDVAAPFVLGRAENAFPWNGELRDVRLWSTSRSQADIQAAMNTSLTGGEPGLAGYWRLDDAAGVVAADRSPNHDSGSLGGGVSASRPTWTPGLAADGTFEFSVNVDSGNALFELNAAGTAETNNLAKLTVASAADLTVANLRVDNAAVQSGDQVTVRWDDVNAGVRPAATSWNDHVVVVNTRTNETLANALVAFDATPTGGGALVPGAARARSFSFHVPDGARGGGLLRITVIADSNLFGAGTVTEANEAGTGEVNNSAVVSVASVERFYPDLAASNVVAPGSARGGDPVTVTWHVTNLGGAAAPGSWNDTVVVSRDTVFGNADDVVLATVAHTGGLAAGAGYDGTVSVTLPAQIEDTVELFVRADAGGAVVEPDSLANNVAPPRAVALTTPFADLAVEAVVAPASASSGARIDVAWRVRNAGDTATGVGPWKDRILLSTDGVIDPGDTMLGEVFHTGPLAPDATYSSTATVTLPEGTSGSFEVLVLSDVEDVVFEKGL
ncbi:MAG TPA: CARDB domain-containing protein, partial [Mycobacteriales bacterium]|nr:CARDB domain-containing protein [Mycobacteriales bacterium]